MGDYVVVIHILFSWDLLKRIEFFFIKIGVKQHMIYTCISIQSNIYIDMYTYYINKVYIEDELKRIYI